MLWWGRRFRLPSSHHKPNRYGTMAIDEDDPGNPGRSLQADQVGCGRTRDSAAGIGVGGACGRVTRPWMPGQAVAEGVRQATWPAQGDSAHQPDYRGRIWLD